jgi:general stress protein 26
MDTGEVMGKIQAIIDAHGAGVLATVDKGGRPHMRWLTPIVFPNKIGMVYALTLPSFPKVAQIRSTPQVEWLFQTTTLQEVVTARGKASIVDNPSLRSEVLEALGRHLYAMWKLTEDVRDLLVLETALEEAVYYRPMTGEKVRVSFHR